MYINHFVDLVAEVTQPSLGVGYEIGRAIDLKKTILCLFRPDSGKSMSLFIFNHISGVIVSLLAPNVVDRGPGSSPDRVDPKTIKLPFVVSPQAVLRGRAKTGWLIIAIMCPSGVACLSADCCFEGE